MANTEMQIKMLKSIEEKTGIKPQEITEDIKAQNFENHNLKIQFVKSKYGLSHGFANLLALKSKEDVNSNSDTDLIEAQYQGKDSLFDIYKKVASFLESLENVELVPKKAYVSVKAKKQFAIIQPSTKTRIDLGLTFPKGSIVPIEPSGSFNSMVSHRIRIQEPEDFNDLVKHYLIEAYEKSL